MVCVPGGRGAAGSGILAVYPFENDGRPATPSAPELTLEGGSFVPGLCGQALHLGGSKVLTALRPDVAPRLAKPAQGQGGGGGAFSITFLFRPSARRSYQIIMAQAGVAPNDRVWWIGYSPGLKHLDFLVREPDNTGQAQVFSTPAVNAGEWHFAAATMSGGVLKLSVTPMREAQPGGIIPSIPVAGARQAASALTLSGRRGESTPETSSYEGDIDELAFWSRALTLADIDALFQRYKTGRPVDGTFDLADAAKRSQRVESTLPFFPPAPSENFRAGPERLRSAGSGAGAAKREFVAPVQLASGDFSVEMELLAPALEGSRFQVDLGADGFLFDGEKGVLRNTGNNGASTFKNRPLQCALKGRLVSGKPFRIHFTMTRGMLTVALDGREVYRNFLGRDTCGEVALTALQGEVIMRKLEMRGAFLRQTFSEVFSSGEANTAFYRIPAIVRAREGALLVFAEARRKDFDDLGDIDMVLRRSTDNGRTWLPIQTLHDGGENSAISCVNPGPIVEPDTGRVHLLFHLVEKQKWGSGDYKVLHLRSDDSGATWSRPVDVRSQLPAEWLSFQPGPGHGIVKQRGAHRGRLIMPGWYVYRDGGARRYASALIYSDDRGKTWQPGGTGMKLSDECMVAELPDGALLMAIRPPLGIPESEFRHFATSRDGGITFDPFTVDPQLRAPVCQSSLFSANDGGLPYFLYPASGSYAPGAAVRRAGLTLRRKLPDGAWSPPQLVYAGRSGYSDLTQMADGRLGIVFEGGRQSYIDGIRFTSVATAPEATSDAAWAHDANARMIKVTGLDLDSSGNLYVAGGEGKAVVVLDRDGRETARWGDFIDDKHGLRIFDDKVWLTDIGKHAVYQCTLDGRILRTFGAVGEAGEDATHFNKPTDVALAPDGSIYITDGYGNSRVVCLAPDGAFRFAWGKRGSGPGEFRSPHNIVIRDNRVYVADRENARIQVFTLSGDFVTEWKNVGHPYGLFLANDGRLYVSMVDDKAGVHAVLIMTLDGQILQTVGGKGSQPGEFDVPHSLTVSADARAIYVGEVETRRVQRILRD
ncbi:gluconolactonase [Opitutaceae bacterium TAV1]|nr:gluconolactonase [Opitutaceae bacterium TAV1]